MRARFAEAGVWLLAACGAADDGAVATVARFDLDVVVTDFGLELWFRDVDGASCTPDTRFPRPGECTSTSDVGSCTVELPCLERVAVERAGVEIARAQLAPAFRSLGVFDPGLFARGDAELVITGCGGELRTPIAAAVLALPSLVELTTDGSYVRGVCSSTGGTGTWAMAAGTLTSLTCHEASATTWRVGPFGRDPSPVDLYIAATAGEPPRATPWGEARMWARRLGSPASTRIVRPQRFADERWQVDVTEIERGSLTVDGTDAAPLDISEWGFRRTPSGPRVYVAGPLASYTAGELVDSLSITRPDGVYRGTLPHAVPLDDLDLGLAQARQIALDVGPVTLTHEGNPSLSHEVTFDAAWTYPVVPRPEP